MLDFIDEISDVLKAEPEHFTPGFRYIFFDGVAEHGDFSDFWEEVFGNQTGHV